MEDKHNTGGTIYQDKDGNVLTEEQYQKLQNGNTGPAEEAADKGGKRK